MASDFAAQSVRKGNTYKFHCPVVGRDTLFMACHWMKMRFWRGERIPCADCATAMNGGKCPAVVMLKMEDAESRFFDTKDTLHSIPNVVINQINNIMLVPSQAGQYELTPQQAEKLFNYVSIEGAEIKEDNSSTSKRRGRKRKVVNDLNVSNDHL